MKVLITGCNGQVGYLLKKTFSNNVEVLALTRKELDITNESIVINTVTSFKPDVIINAAAYTAVDKAETEEELAYLVNRDACEYLAKAANAIDATLIHISTDYVFEGNKIGVYSETDTVNPQGVYGKSKLAGELAIIKHCTKHIILRTAWVFGEHGNNFVKTMLRLGKERDALSIVGDQFGAPTYAGDIAKAISEIVIKIATDKAVNWGIYHYSGFPYVSWFEFSQEIFDKAKENGLIEKPLKLTQITSTDFPTPAKRPENSKLDCTAIEYEFGITPSNWKAELENIENYK